VPVNVESVDPALRHQCQEAVHVTIAPQASTVEGISRSGVLSVHLDVSVQ